jgi:hypothetical protein
MPEFRRLRPRRQRDLDGFILSLACVPFLSETKGMPLSASDEKARFKSRSQKNKARRDSERRAFIRWTAAQS